MKVKGSAKPEKMYSEANRLLGLSDKKVFQSRHGDLQLLIDREKYRRRMVKKTQLGLAH